MRFAPRKFLQTHNQAESAAKSARFAVDADRSTEAEDRERKIVAWTEIERVEAPATR